MKVIQVELEDWQAEVFAEIARTQGVPESAVFRVILERDALRQVDSACERLLDPLWTAHIEYRLAHLFRQ